MQLLNEGTRLAQELGNESALGVALSIKSYKEPERSEALLKEALTIAHRWRNIRMKCSIYPALAYAAGNRGDLETARSYHEKAYHLSMKVGATFRAAATLTCLCEVSLMLGLRDDARTYAQRITTMGTYARGLLEGVALGTLAMLAVQDEKYGDALEMLDTAEALTQAAGYRSETAKLKSVRAQALHLSGRVQEAQAEYASVVRLIRNDGALEPYQVWLSEGYMVMAGHA